MQTRRSKRLVADTSTTQNSSSLRRSGRPKRNEFKPPRPGTRSSSSSKRIISPVNTGAADVRHLENPANESPVLIKVTESSNENDTYSHVRRSSRFRSDTATRDQDEPSFAETAREILDDQVINDASENCDEKVCTSNGDPSARCELSNEPVTPQVETVTIAELWGTDRRACPVPTYGKRKRRRAPRASQMLISCQQGLSIKEDSSDSERDQSMSEEEKPSQIHAKKGFATTSAAELAELLRPEKEFWKEVDDVVLEEEIVDNTEENT